jgi:hypothetical protein
MQLCGSAVMQFRSLGIRLSNSLVNTIVEIQFSKYQERIALTVK